MGISAVYGLPGKGKSQFMTYYGIYLANKYRKRLVTNYALNPYRLARYCRYMGYTWLLKNFNKDTIFYVSCDDNLSSMLKIDNAIVCIDEMGIYLPARGSTNTTPKTLLKDFCQVRHDCQFLIYAAQSENQVDIALRNLTEEVFWCNGTSVFDEHLNNQKLIYRTVRRFTTDAFAQFMSDPKLRKNPLKTKILANKSWAGMLTASDLFLFSIYSSFDRLEGQKLSFSSNLLRYEPFPKNEHFSTITGVLPANTFHRYSKLITWMFNTLPSNFLPKIEAWDTKLSSFDCKFRKLSKFETKCLKYFAFYFIGLFVLGLVF
jgi:hypothetical protein